MTPWRDKSAILLLTGSAGGGKSRLATEKIHGFCLKYPGATALMMRKAREWCSKSIIPFYRQTVVTNDQRVKFNKSEGTFYYDNGSVVYTGGMMGDEQREAVRSIGGAGGLDIVLFEEATAFDSIDLDEIVARMRGKAADWRQIILSTNPDSPTHWIFSRLIQGRAASVYYSGAKDNPYNPAEYIGNLDRLSGTLRNRLALGQWVQASGLVYDGVWSDRPNDGNVTEAAEYEPNAGPILWAVDDGYSAGSAPDTRGVDPITGHYVADAHPRVILFVQQRSDGSLVIFDEFYACLKLSDQHIHEALERDYPEPDFIVHGPGAAEIRGRFYEAGITPRQSTAKVDESIKEMRLALAADANGWRRVRVHPRCKHLRAEMGSYAYEPGTEKPAKQFDHGVDALRGLIWILRFER